MQHKNFYWRRLTRIQPGQSSFCPCPCSNCTMTVCFQFQCLHFPKYKFHCHYCHYHIMHQDYKKTVLSQSYCQIKTHTYILTWIIITKTVLISVSTDISILLFFTIIKEFTRILLVCFLITYLPDRWKQASEMLCVFTQLKIPINWPILNGLDMPVVPMVATLWFFLISYTQ